MNWVLVAILAIPAFFIQTVIHEASHLIIPKLSGYKVWLYPYPHKRNGRFYFGYAEWEGRPLPIPLYGFTLLMPRLADIFIIIAIGALVSHSRGGDVFTALKVWQGAALVDFSYNTLGIFRHVRNDANEVVNALWPKTDAWVLNAASIALVVIGWVGVIVPLFL
jgi:hypothetical protein